MKSRSFAMGSAALALGAFCGLVSGCEEAVDEATNNIRCDDICEYAVDCGIIGGSIDACQNSCEAAGDESQTVEDRIENCAQCLDHDDRSCAENDELCAAECDRNVSTRLRQLA